MEIGFPNFQRKTEKESFQFWYFYSYHRKESVPYKATWQSKENEQ